MLTICPTPIGNLEDVTPRQRSALEEADAVACEDTRRTGKLLERFGIDRSDGTPELIPYHEHNEEEAADRLMRDLRSGRKVVLVSDAGTPLVSDPGYRIVERASSAPELEVRALPGPCAALVALTASGLPTHAFQFRGFPPESGRGRRRFLREVDSGDATTVLYESPERVTALLTDICGEFGEERPVCVGRELTKLHEEFVRGPVSEVLEEFERRDEVRGECTVVIAPRPEDETADDEEIDRKIRELLERGLSARTIREVIAELFEVRRSGLYDRIERLRE